MMPEPEEPDQDPNTVHCRECGRTLTAQTSVEREVGPVCARHITEAVPA